LRRKNTQINEVLDHNSKTNCEGKVSNDDCHSALSLMAKNKSPGLDGIPVEFYKHFWVGIVDILIDSFKESFDNISISESQRCGVLSLIYKNGDKSDLKKYRPISLTNTDYRIIVFTLSLCLQKVLAHLISSDQTCYIESRYKGTNIRTILDLIEYCDNCNKNGLLLFFRL
jgi:hypothetical protein